MPTHFWNYIFYNIALYFNCKSNDCRQRPMVDNMLKVCLIGSAFIANFSSARATNQSEKETTDDNGGHGYPRMHPCISTTSMCFERVSNVCYRWLTEPYKKFIKYLSKCNKIRNINKNNIFFLLCTYGHIYIGTNEIIILIRNY